MQKIRNYFIGKLLDTDDFLERSRVLVVFNLCIYSIFLTLIISLFLFISGEALLAYRALFSILIIGLFLFLTKKRNTIKPLAHLLINLTGIVILSNVFLIFQAVDYSTFCMFIALTVFSWVVLPRKTSTVYTLFYGSSIALVLYFNAAGIQWTDLTPKIYSPSSQLISTLIGIILIIYTLWEFDSAVREFTIFLRRQNNELKYAKKTAEEMIRLKTNFLTNMSHEIRTPINGIMGLSELISSEKCPEEIKKLVSMQRESSKRLISTINSIIELAKLEAESGPVETADSLIEPILENSIKLFQTKAKSKGLKINYQPTGNNFSVKSTDIILQKSIENILDNAIKFTNEGSVNIDIEATKHHIYLNITDTGIGISKDFLPKVYNAFEQESEGLGRSHEGSGVGLSIVKKYMDSIGGNITIESSKGIGTRVSLIFPTHSNQII